MEIYSIRTKERETYKVELKFSLLWEAALGIAAITNSSLIETLDLSQKKRKDIKTSLTKDMIKQLEYVQTHNTWKTLLQLLHNQDFKDLNSYCSFVKNLSSEELKAIAIPYLGSKLENKRIELIEGSDQALNELQQETKDKSFLPAYLEFISKAETEKLKDHLINVMYGWYQTIIEPEKERIQAILERDIESKKMMMEKLEPEQFIEWVTDGIKYPPEPGVFKVILIPHYIYRPWNVEADLEGVKVFYYPVANESISFEDKYVPNKMLVQRYKALGDENRLKILKMIKAKRLNLQELTDELKMGKTTVHHHLKILKSARLISDESARYVVNSQTLELLSDELKLYLEENDTTGGRE
ncbi:ArsR/SmtB family transcription factor [Salinibacillus xinjiangensis]|uniref:ArsR family transcriptional regulator n=1 Tax=Salinibacillus xinjiangensis TaxID=1229268 RepID=A0A6G1X886_9BACI|nr:metalloregulator ArsR/SmtB family transcription factor [Salinibacillus xinjiangensis]MRG87157.1 ArsR family transcriptional regulator [Salinibacillus xinjiangensis]